MPSREDIDHWFGSPLFDGSEHPLARPGYAEEETTTGMQTPENQVERFRNLMTDEGYTAAVKDTTVRFDRIRASLSPTAVEEIELLDEIQADHLSLLTAALNSSITAGRVVNRIEENWS